jgi:drug/metabolite transporter (DMT)-like permease
MSRSSRSPTAAVAALLACAGLVAGPGARAEEPTRPASSSATPAAAVSSAAAPTPDTAAPTPDTAPSTTRTAGFVLAGLGFVGIGIGSFFAIRAASEAGSAAADPLLCTNGVCTAAGRSTIAELRTQRTIATLLVGGGMIGLAGGAIMLSLDDEPEASQPTPKLAIGAAIGDDGAGLRVGLTF